MRCRWNPRPGSAIAAENSDYIIPDVVVRKFEGQWIVELNADVTPQIRINPEYEDLAKKYLQKLKAEQERALAKAKKPSTSAAASSTAVCLVLK